MYIVVVYIFFPVEIVWGEKKILKIERFLIFQDFHLFLKILEMVCKSMG